MKGKLNVLLTTLLFLTVANVFMPATATPVLINPIVSVSADGKTLTFSNGWTSGGTSYNIENSYGSTPAWCSQIVTKVVFDPSFAVVLPTSTAYWFNGCSSLTTIEGLEYLNADSLKSADFMFCGCKSLTTLDLSGFNTYKLTSCHDMFSQCSNLHTIYGNRWNIIANMSTTEKQKFMIWKMNHPNEHYMFGGCTSLVGGAGTQYDDSKTSDYEYCRIDGGTTSPGYFTCKPSTMSAYAVLYKGVLTLYYDNLRYSHIGEKHDITFGEKPSYCGDKSIKQVQIDASMSNVAPTSTSQLFADLYELASIKGIENLNTSKVIDMSLMFSNCCTLGAIDLSGLDTSSATNMTSMFQHCFSLCHIDLSGLNTSNVTNMSYMFYRCMSLQSLDVSQLNTSKVTNMTAMFKQCSKLKSLDLSNFNTSQVTTMSEMFNDCRLLQTLNISSFNTTNVTDMSYMFSRCNSLQEIVLTNFNTQKVTNMKGMFGQYKNDIELPYEPSPAWYYYYITTKRKLPNPEFRLHMVDISTFNTSNVSNMYGMFEYQPNLATIYVSGDWSTVKVSSSNRMFTDSENLVGGNGTTYDEDHTDHTYARVDGGASSPGYLTLKGSQGVQNTKEPYAVINGSTLTFYYDELRSRRSGTSFPISSTFNESNKPSWIASYGSSITKAVIHTSMKDFRPHSTAYWFYGLKSIATVEGLQNINTMDVTDMTSMFERCTELTNLDLENFNTSKVTSMNSMFGYCPALTTLDLGSFDTSQVTAMDSMFIENTALKSINLSSFNTSNVENFMFMFYTCRALDSLDVTHFNTSKATNMRQMFMRCSSLKTLELRNFDTSNVTDMHAMFYECEALTTLNVSTFDTRKVTNMYCMFYKCTSLATLDVSGFSTEKVKDMAYMFREMTSLKELHLSGFNTSSVTTMKGLFYKSNALKTIYVKNDWNIPSNADTGYMFSGCTSLVGGSGTVYDSSNTSSSYAHIDGGTASPGYFTSLVSSIPSNLQAYAVYNDNTLTFYYDNKANSRNGTKYVISAYYNRLNLPKWILDYNRRSFSKAVFDVSFASYRPVSTAFWFYNCSAMTTILGIENLNTSSVTTMAEMFRYCSVLNNLDLRTFDTSNVTDMSCMFCYCWKLTNVNVSTFNTSKVIDMSHLFHQCPISSVDVSNFNTENVKDMSIMFAECKRLSELDLKSFNTANVTNMNWMFIGDRSLKTIYASNKWSTEKVVNSDNMFYDNTHLVGGRGTKYTSEHTDKEYACIDGLNCAPGYLTSDGSYEIRDAYVEIVDTVMTFYYDDMRNCRQGEIYPVGQLANITLNGFNVPTWHHASLNVNDVTWVQFDKSFADYRPTSTSCWFSDLYQLKKVSDICYLNTSETTEMGCMFSDCSNLEYLDLSSLSTENVTTMEMMFYSCHSLHTLKGINKWDTSNVTNMNDMFFGCSKLKSIDVSNFNTGKVTDMSRMFKLCYSLTNLDVSGFDTQKATDMSAMFYECIRLTKLDVRKFDTRNVTDMSYMFNRCSALTELDVSGFNTRNVTTMSSMFCGCSSLTSLDASGFDTRNVTHMDAMFDECSSLVSLDVSGFDTHKVTYMHNMFRNCRNLTSLNVSSFTANSTAHTTEMFSSCRNLISLDLCGFDIKASEYISHMFNGCNSLTTIYCNNDWNMPTPSEEPNGVFSGCYSLVGAKGTQYAYSLSIDNIDYTYARPDNAPSLPGFFTPKDSTPTDIRSVADDLPSRFYTVDGRCLENQPTAKGIYITNGHKLVVK